MSTVLKSIGGELFCNDALVALGSSGFKNLFINGDFQIWQRGTSSTISATMIADRWWNYYGGVTGTTQRSTNVNSPTQSKFIMHYTLDSAPSSPVIQMIGQKIENPMNFHNQTVTFSVALNSTAEVSAPLSVRIAVNDINGLTTIDEVDLQVTNGYDRTSCTINIGSLYSYSFDSDSFIQVYLGQTVAEALDIYIADVQLEFGSVMTEFDYRPQAIEEILCHRYYWQGNSTEGSGYGYHYGIADSILMNACSVSFPIQMRTTPTISYSGATFVGCTHTDLVATHTGLVHRVSKDATSGSFRVYGATYTANTEL